MLKTFCLRVIIALTLLVPIDLHSFYRGEEAASHLSLEPAGLIVKFKSGSGPRLNTCKKDPSHTGLSSVDAINAKYNVKRMFPLLSESAVLSSARSFKDVFVLRVENSADIPALEYEYEKLPNVEYAEPDYPVEFYDVPNDSLYQFQWSLNNTGQNHYHTVRNWGSNNDELVLVNGVDDADIDAGEVYQNPPDKTVTVIVAIIDTGVDMDHPDLADHIWTNSGELPDNGIDDDHNGYIDDMHGWDFASSLDLLDQGDNDPTDQYGHGTHCAGIIAAIANNSIGIAGIAPDCRIMALKFDPLPLVSRIAGALIYAADNGADVISMSFGLTFRSDLIEEAINYAKARGVVLCAASGNSGSQAVNFPAGYDATIAIGASNDSDHVTSFSTYGNHISVCAPGLSILSLRADNTDMYGSGYPREPQVHVIDSIYYLASGTSMACPHVAGVAAWLRSVSPGLTPERAREIIELSADDIVDPYGVGWNLPGKDKYSGYGRVNLHNALMLAPKVRAEIESPVYNEIVTGIVEITGIADGADFSDYIVEYGEGDNPTSWTQIISSGSPVTDGLLASWNTVGLDGKYTIRLQAGDYNISNVSVFVANETVTEILSPSDEETVANFVSIIGNAFSPDFSHILLEYKPDTTFATEWEEIAHVSVPVFGDVVGGWYLEDIPQGDYHIRLSIFANDSIMASDTVTVHVQSIFSTEHAWRANLNGYPTIIPNYGDFDGDGVNEIIVGTSSGITVFNLDGTPKTDGIPLFPANNYMVPIAVGNLDGDGIDDIVAVGYDPPILYGYPSGESSFESYLGIFPPIGNYYRTEHEFPKVFLKDIDSDGMDEIHVFIYNGSMSKIFLFEPNGELINIFDYFSEYLPVDLDGDGLDEIYACNRGFCLLRQINHYDGSTNDSLLIQMNGSNFNCMGISAYDIDNDDTLELILYGYYLDFGYWIYAFEYGLNLIEGWPHDMNIDDFVVPTAPVFGDIDNDGQPEYFTSYFDLSASYIIAWNIDGTPYIPANPNGLLTTTPEPSVLNMLLLADMNGDDMVDIVACADNDMFNTYSAQRIYAWDNEGRLLSGFPIITVPDAFTSDRFTPCIGDINGDGNVDLIMTTPDSAHIFVNFPSSPYNKCKSPSPFWRYNRRMNNIGPMPSDCNPTDIVENNQLLLPDSYRLSQNYPNPFNLSSIIRYAIPYRSHVTISIYNLLGRKIRTLIDKSKTAGSHTISWDGRDANGLEAASGIYFYQMTADDFVDSKKMILIK